MTHCEAKNILKKQKQKQTVILSLLNFKKHPRKTCCLLWFCLSDGLNLWLNKNAPSTPSPDRLWPNSSMPPAVMGRVSEDGVGRFCSFLLMATEFFICQFYAVERQLASYSPQITEKQRSGRGGKVLNKISQSMTRKPPFAKRHAPSYLPTYNVSLEDLFFLQTIVLGGAERGREELGLIGQWIISKGTS